MYSEGSKSTNFILLIRQSLGLLILWNGCKRHGDSGQHSLNLSFPLIFILNYTKLSTSIFFEIYFECLKISLKCHQNISNINFGCDFSIDFDSFSVNFFSIPFRFCFWFFWFSDSASQKHSDSASRLKIFPPLISRPRQKPPLYPPLSDRS